MKFVYDRFSQRKMYHFLQVLEVFEIWICHIFKLFYLTKVTSTLSKRAAECDDYGNNNKLYLKITTKFYPLVNVIRK